MAGEQFELETRFSRSRGIFPYILAILGLAVLVVIFMIVTGIGRDRLPYSDYFAVHAPTAADGSEALSLVSLTQKEDEKTLSIEGSVANRTDSKISGLVAVIVVNDKYTLPAQTVNVPLDPVDLAPKGMATFKTTIMLGESGLGGYSVQFRLPNDGPFVPHKDERPPEPPSEPEPKPSR